jgi:hypothetical protein
MRFDRIPANPGVLSGTIAGAEYWISRPWVRQISGTGSRALSLRQGQMCRVILVCELTVFCMDQDGAGTQSRCIIDRQVSDFGPVSRGQTRADAHTTIGGCPESIFDPVSCFIGAAIRVATLYSPVRIAIAPPSGTPAPVLASLALLPNPGFRKCIRIFESHASENF